MVKQVHLRATFRVNTAVPRKVLGEKVLATVLKGIVGSFNYTGPCLPHFRKTCKNDTRHPWTSVFEAKKNYK